MNIKLQGGGNGRQPTGTSKPGTAKKKKKKPRKHKHQKDLEEQKETKGGGKVARP